MGGELLDTKDITLCPAEPSSMGVPKTYVVEHLDPECGAWSMLEYVTIAKESIDAGAEFRLSSAPHGLSLPDVPSAVKPKVEHRGVEELYADRKERVCLLDPAAKEELSPLDAERFDIFVFGGILGMKEEHRAYS